MPFNITDVGTNQRPVCNFLSVINSNSHPISYRFEIIGDCLFFGHFALLSPLWGLMGNEH